MGVGDLRAVFRKHWLNVLVTTVLCAVGVGVASYLATPIYKSKASVFVSLPYGNTAGELSQGSSFAQGQMESFAELATRPVVTSRVISELDLDTTPKQLAEDLAVTVSGGTVILEIVASSPSPATAARIADSVAKHLGAAAQEVSPKRDDGKPTVEMTLVEKAAVPQFQSSPNKKRNVAAAIVAGFMLGVAVALVREKLDTKARTLSDVTDNTAAPLLAEIADDVALSKREITMRGDSLSPAAEAFRRLRTNLEFLGVDQRPFATVVTSSIPGEGKSTVSVNLAFACAQAGDRVLLVDADLRKPMIAKSLGLVGSAGLTTVLTERASFADVVQKVGDDVSVDVITSGIIPPNPAELLGSAQMKSLIKQVSTEYDVIIFDAPPLLPVVDAAVLGRQVAGAILVARLNVVNKDAIAKSAASIHQVGASLLGVVVNGLPRSSSGYGSYYTSEEPV